MVQSTCLHSLWIPRYWPVSHYKGTCLFPHSLHDLQTDYIQWHTVVPYIARIRFPTAFQSCKPLVDMRSGSWDIDWLVLIDTVIWSDKVYRLTEWLYVVVYSCPLYHQDQLFDAIRIVLSICLCYLWLRKYTPVCVHRVSQLLIHRLYKSWRVL